MFNSRFFDARYWKARLFNQTGAAPVVGVFAIYEALVYCQLSPSADTAVNLSPAVQLKTNLTPSANVGEALSPAADTDANATPSAEVNSS